MYPFTSAEGRTRSASDARSPFLSSSSSEPHLPHASSAARFASSDSFGNLVENSENEREFADALPGLTLPSSVYSRLEEQQQGGDGTPASLVAVNASAHRSLLISSLLTTFLYIIFGVACYSHWEKWTVTDSLYFVLVTLTTVGYGDQQDFLCGGDECTGMSQTARLFTCLYALGGILLMGAAFGVVVAEVVAKGERTRERMRLRRMRRINEGEEGEGKEAREGSWCVQEFSGAEQRHKPFSRLLRRLSAILCDSLRLSALCCLVLLCSVSPRLSSLLCLISLPF